MNITTIHSKKYVIFLEYLCKNILFLFSPSVITEDLCFNSCGLYAFLSTPPLFAINVVKIYYYFITVCLKV